MTGYYPNFRFVLSRKFKVRILRVFSQIFHFYRVVVRGYGIIEGNVIDVICRRVGQYLEKTVPDVLSTA